MIVGTIVGWDRGDDDIFNINSLRNRDDCLQPYRVMRDFGLTQGIEFHTPDIIKKLGLNVDFNLYIESDLNIRSGRNYLLRMETEYIVPINGDLEYLNQFDLVFTCEDSLVDSIKYIKLEYPNPLLISYNDGYANRRIFSCMISGNKFLTKHDPRELYSRRVDVIRWFEKNHPNKFNLYGMGWDKPARKKSGIPKLIYKFEKFMNLIMRRKAFPSYKGSVAAKREILENSRFCFCYENISGVKGYITEKIFDCFFAGCVPIYWGDDDISQHIPKNCFIDRCQFKTIEDLYEFMVNLPEREYLNYQKEIRDFLLGDGFKPFSSEAFAKKIVSSIKADFESRG